MVKMGHELELTMTLISTSIMSDSGEGAPFIDPLSAAANAPQEDEAPPSPVPEQEFSSFEGAKEPEEEKPAEVTEEKETTDKAPLPPRPTAPPPTTAAPAAAAAAPPASPAPTPAAAPAASPAAPSSAPSPGSGIRPPRVISEAEKAALTILGEQREKLRTEYNSRRVVGEAEKMIEDKVAGALQGRANVGMHGVKDLLSFVKGNADMDDAAAKNYTRFSTLFGNETGTSNDALLGYSSSCKSMQKLHADLFSTLSSVELRRAEEALASFEDGAKKVSGACSTMVADLQSARERVEKAYQAQEKAWSDCEEADKHSSRVATVDSDPWLAGLRYQTAVKALETVQKTHGSDLGRLCQEMKAHDLKRLETMKSVLRSYAEARRNLLAKALQNAEELCGMIEKIEPQQDSEGWLAAAEISDVELKQAEEKSSEAPPTISASSLGVWIPDEAVRQCNRCQMAFGIMRRKHHCRRCGHVFCDKCSSHTAVLPQSFGFSTQPQRVCEPCLELLQESVQDTSQSEPPAFQSLEVLKAGPLIKKGGMLKSNASKQRHFVVTRAGFLHYFDSKFDPQPKGSICLHYARIVNDDSDACAFNIDIEEAGGPQGGFFALRQKMSKTKFILRTNLGSMERDAWVKTLQGCSNYGSSVA